MTIQFDRTPFQQAVCNHYKWTPENGFASGFRRKYHGRNGAALWEKGATAFQLWNDAAALDCTPEQLLEAIKELNSQHRIVSCGGLINVSILDAVQRFGWSYKRTRIDYRMHGDSLQVWEAGRLDGWRIEMAADGTASTTGPVPEELIAITKPWNCIN